MKQETAMGVMREEVILFWGRCLKCYWFKGRAERESRFRPTLSDKPDLHHAYGRSKRGPEVCENFYQLAPLHHACHMRITKNENVALRKLLLLYSPTDDAIPERFRTAFGMRQAEWEGARRKKRDAVKSRTKKRRDAKKKSKVSKWDWAKNL